MDIRKPLGALLLAAMSLTQANAATEAEEAEDRKSVV